MVSLFGTIVQTLINNLFFCKEVEYMHLAFKAFC